MVYIHWWQELSVLIKWCKLQLSECEKDSVNQAPQGGQIESFWGKTQVLRAQWGTLCGVSTRHQTAWQDSHVRSCGVHVFFVSHQAKNRSWMTSQHLCAHVGWPGPHSNSVVMGTGDSETKDEIWFWNKTWNNQILKQNIISDLKHKDCWESIGLTVGWWNGCRWTESSVGLTVHWCNNGWCCKGPSVTVDWLNVCDCTEPSVGLIGNCWKCFCYSRLMKCLWLHRIKCWFDCTLMKRLL